MEAEQTQAPPPGAADALSTLSEWQQFFGRYSHIILVANSDEVDLRSLKARYPEPSSLFIFFNKVYKVLDRPFEGRALLVSRAQPKGANIVYRDEVADVLKFFPQNHFAGILNIRLDAAEKLNTKADFKGAPTGHLDLASYCDEFYPADKLPTSGFAMAFLLCDMRIPAEIVLAGFSGRRSERWRVVSAHDWTFEQVFLRLFARIGKISINDGLKEDSYALLSRRFPEIPASDISFTIAEVLSSRLSDANAQIDKLISLTNVLRSADNFLRGLRPRLLRKRPTGAKE